jgi:hypothetical protein
MYIYGCVLATGNNAHRYTATLFLIIPFWALAIGGKRLLYLRGLSGIRLLPGRGVMRISDTKPRRQRIEFRCDFRFEVPKCECRKKLGNFKSAALAKNTVRRRKTER